MLTFDAHIDVPWQFTKHGVYNLWNTGRGAFDFRRMEEGGLASACFALYLSDKMQDEMGPTAALAKIYQQVMWIREQTYTRMVDAPNEASLAMIQGTVPIWLGLEGGRLLNNDVSNLRKLRTAHLRYLTLCHNRNTNWCNSATDTPIHERGLDITLARPMIKTCNELNIFIDVSHAHDTAIHMAWSLSDKPIIATHSGSRHLVDLPRNLGDIEAKMIMKGGGIIGVPFAKRFVGKYTPSDHIDRFAQLAGTHLSVGIGSDLDGAEMCGECPDVSRWYDAFAHDLSALDWTDDMIADVAGNNFMRIFA